MLFFEEKRMSIPTYSLSSCGVKQAKRALGCSIEILRDIYMCVCLCETHTKNTYAKMRGRNYIVQARACSKSVLGV